MAWLLIRDGLLFAFAFLGLGAPWLAALKNWPPPERLALAVGAALIGGWLAGFAVYLTGFSLRWFWLAPAAGLLLSAIRPAHVLALWRESQVRGSLGRLALLCLWCLGWQSLVVSYSGAAWQGDWYEHYDRAQFFLARWPHEFLFLDIYPLTARPPLVNVWSAALMSASGGAFYHYQIFMTLLSCLVLLPLAILISRWSGRRSAQWLLLVLLMCNPLFVQNATFPWTKLAAGFFVLLAWSQLTAAPASGRFVAAALALSGGMLAHYSTGLWIVAFALAWVICHRARLGDAGFRFELVAGTLAAAAVFAVWLGWAIVQYGINATFTQNSTLSLGPALTFIGRLQATGLNLLHTLCPVSLVGMDHPLLAQAGWAGWLRDWFFILYQLRIWWAFGSVGGLVLVWYLWNTPSTPHRRFAWIVLPVVIVLNAAAHAQPDYLGLAHIGLQPMILLGLGFIAASAGSLPRGTDLLYACGIGFDVVMGIVLHFAVQAGWMANSARDLTLAAQINWQNKLQLGLIFLSDRHAAWWGVSMILGAGILAWRGWRTARVSPDPKTGRRLLHPSGHSVIGPATP